MHPIMKNLRSTVANVESDGPQRTLDCGIANTGDEAFTLRKQHREDRLPTGPPTPVDVFRSPSPKMSEERDLLYNAGNSISIDTEKVLKPVDFKPDLPSTSPAQRHMQAAELYRNSKYTKDLETWAFDTFLYTCRQLLARPSTKLGLLYLNDFISNFIDHPPRYELAMQMLAIQQHIQQPALQRLFMKITDKNEKGELTQMWLIDLINVLEMILEEESSLNNQLSAVNVACNKLSLHFAKKACGGHYPSADKLAKTSVYFQRIITSILTLAESLGCYERNTVARKPLKRVKREKETSDEAYMFSLKTALEGIDTDDNDSNDDADDDENFKFF